MTIIPSLPPEGEATCASCQKIASPVVYQGAELEPICMPCLEKLDPARAALLSKLTRGNPPAGTS